MIRDILVFVCLPAILGSASALAVYVAVKSSDPQYACDTITKYERDPETGTQAAYTEAGVFLSAPGGANLGKAICRKAGE